MGGIFDHFQVGSGDIADPDRQVDYLGGTPRLIGCKKRGFKKKGQDFYPLGPYQFHGNHAVQTA
jgi:hypothetical protein